MPEQFQIVRGEPFIEKATCNQGLDYPNLEIRPRWSLTDIAVIEFRDLGAVRITGKSPSKQEVVIVLHSPPGDWLLFHRIATDDRDHSVVQLLAVTFPSAAAAVCTHGGTAAIQKPAPPPQTPLVPKQEKRPDTTEAELAVHQIRLNARKAKLAARTARLAEVMKKHNFSVATLAEAVKTSENNLRHILQGNNYGLNYIGALAKELGVTVKWLEHGDEEPPKVKDIEAVPTPSKKVARSELLNPARYRPHGMTRAQCQQACARRTAHIKEAMGQTGINTSQLSVRTGIPLKDLSNILQGNIPGVEDDLSVIATALGMNVEWFKKECAYERH